MFRLAALGLACSIAVATPALAVPVTFVLNKNNPSSIEFECTPSRRGDDCGLKDPTFAFKNKTNILANPDATFDFLQFTGNGAESDDEDDEEQDDKKNNKKDDKKDDDNRILSGEFLARITLFLTVGGSDPIRLFSEGFGSYSTEDGVLKNFSIEWSPIDDFIVDGVGSFSAAFQDIDPVRAMRLRDNDEYDDEDDDDEDEWEDEWAKSVAVSATITPVPLPAGAWLLLSGIAVLGAARLRRRAKS